MPSSPTGKISKSCPDLKECIASADKFWVNISSSVLNADSKVRAIVTSRKCLYQGKDIKYDVEVKSYALDLLLQPEGHYAAEFSDARKMLEGKDLALVDHEKTLNIYEIGQDGCVKFDQEIAVHINGVWPKDIEVKE